MTNRKSNILLLIGAFTFAFFIGTIIHEFGHVIALRLFGVNQYKVVIHPFLGNQVIWNVNDDYIGYVDAAGPLFNILIGNAFLIKFWRQRHKIVPSILLLGPVALIQEGSNTLIQISLNIPGTDAIRIITAGVPGSVLVVIAALFLLLGVLILTIELPLYGISPDDSLIDRLTMILPGFVAYMVAIYLYGLVFNPAGAIRGLVLIIFSSIIAILVSYIYVPVLNWVGTWLHFDLVQSDWKAISKVLGLSIITLIFGLILFN
jgi:hypothetical protein